MHAQEVITLQNPSFEDLPRKGAPGMPSIRGWHDCGLTSFPAESPPDIHPVPAYAWEVSKVAYDGQTFLGMVVRYNDTYESLSQALSSPIQAGICYNFSAFIAKSELYKSATTRSDSIENFDRPAVFQIWGGNSFCQKSELLGESPAVTNVEWKQYKFLFQPRKSYKYITIEAFYKTPILDAYNGHVLVDKLSDIVPVECPMIPQDLVADVSDPPKKMEVNSVPNTPHSSSSTPKSGTTSKPNNNTGTQTNQPAKPVLLPELAGQKVYVGQKIRLNYLSFKADSVNLLSDSYKVLDELASYLKTHPKTIIEIGGHTNTIPPDEYCNRLSTARAKSVQEYLISRGIPDYRLEYKGYGKTDPLIPYDKYNKEARTKNQRVEIKILSLS
ncbi:MAG TPA: OmpA family protein [Saprospiraceae bacterium]|nr:OmpA family protein [Saprospiraceae bacterium]